MKQGRYRILIVATHPVQYAAPIFRRMAAHPRLDLEVAYCSFYGAEPCVDPEFGAEIVWDVPLLEGYSWRHVPNRSPAPGLGRFWGLCNPGLWGVAQSGGFDAVILLTGYRYASFWIHWPRQSSTAALCYSALMPRSCGHAMVASGNRW